MTNRWAGDVLDRKSTGDFLYRVIQQRFEAYHSKPGDGALCVALDAEWGAGKTFFVRHWSQDIEACQHPVVRFDAWANDLADDPLLAFMAELQLALEPLLKKLPVAGKVRSSAAKLAKRIWKQAPKAVLPVLGAVAAGGVKVMTGVDPSQLFANVETVQAAEGMAADALKKFFEIATESHTEKQTAIREMKKAIEELLSYLNEQREATLPMFVFIDELDRCRPDYAVRLLEGVKHLFDAQGICFVFSTNLSQLSASTKAIYGPEFDGARYLRRFFSAVYLLPDPDNRAFAAKLAITTSLTTNRLEVVSSIVTAQPGVAQKKTPAEIVSEELALIAQLFALDLRSQEHLFRFVEEAAAGISDGEVIYPLYLFFLAAAYQHDKFNFISASPGSAKLDEALSELPVVNIRVSTFNNQGRSDSRQVSVSEIIKVFDQIASTPLGELGKIQESPQVERYPKSLINVAMRFIGRHPYMRTDFLPLQSYYSLVRNAGKISERASGAV